MKPITGEAGTTCENVSIVVHSHPRWDFVWQRPQQIHSRLAAHHPILFLEPPASSTELAHLEITEPHPNVVRVVPRIPQWESMSVESQCKVVRALLLPQLASHGLLKGRFARPVHWFYSPLTAPCMLDELPSAGVVYDCMDELANFRFAHPDIAEREKLLLARADVVFTGGYQLYESKSRHNPNTHFFGCGVDVEHFGRARSEATALPLETGSLPRPILGYFGVIDERLDYDLLAHLARAFPTGSVVMVGPFAKIDPDTLPREPNIHWLGQRDYRDLPALVKSFDVCLMPFALNEATRYINPTKTLEYMAAAKPIVSTAVPDVVRNFAPTVRVARTNEAFANAVRDALAGPDERRIDDGVDLANRSTWEAIVASMRAHMLSAIGRSTSQSLLASIAGRAARSARPSQLPHESSLNGSATLVATVTPTQASAERASPHGN